MGNYFAPMYWSSFYITCQTPSATIKYSITSANDARVAPWTGGVVTPPDIASRMPTDSLNSVSLYNGAASASFVQNDGIAPNDNYGYIVGIRVEVSKTDPNGNTHTAVAYNVATRSVIVFEEPVPLPPVGAGKVSKLWLRGGARNGSSPGFPLSWDERDPAGIQLMGRHESTYWEDVGYSSAVRWWWDTWNLRAPAYFHFVAGTVPTVTDDTSPANISRMNDVAANGPLEWAWSEGGWSYMYESFPLYPGTSLKFSSGTTVGGKTWGGFPNNYTGQRPHLY